MFRATLTVAVVLLAGASLASCSSENAVSQSDVEKQVSSELAKQIGEAPDDVTCPGDLTAEVGTKMTCVLTDGSTEVDVALVVTKVDDGTAEFDIQVADTAN